MSDTSFGDTSLGDSAGKGASDSSGLGGIGGLGGLAALGVGAAGFGTILGMGESPLPTEYGQALGQVPALQANAGTLFNEGQTLTAQGTQALADAEAGRLTPEQQAQLGQFSTGLTNKSRQMFASMGRNPDADTAAITQQANDDAQVNAMAQQQIQTTIQLGLGELSSGSNFSGQSLAASSAASNILLQAGQAQLQQDKAYSDSLTSAFSSIGKMFAAAAPAALALL
jgi:hypothetical protein